MSSHSVSQRGASARVEDVAKHFGVQPRTVRRWVKETDIPHRKVGGPKGPLRFNLAEVDAWSRRGEAPAA